MKTNPANMNEATPDGLCDEQGPIPTFGPIRLDDQGRIVISEEEIEARAEAGLRMLRALAFMPDDDPPGTDEEFMRNIDAERPHRPFFKGMY